MDQWETGRRMCVIWMMDNAESKGGSLLVRETHVRLTWLPRRSVDPFDVQLYMVPWRWRVGLFA